MRARHVHRPRRRRAVRSQVEVLETRALMAELGLTSALIRPDGRVVELVFSGPQTGPIRTPDGSAAAEAGRRLAASTGAALEPLGAVVQSDGSTLTWTCSFLVSDPLQVVTFGSGPVALSASAHLFDDGGGNWTAAFTAAPAVNDSLVDADGFTTDRFERGTGGVTLYVSSSHGSDAAGFAAAQNAATPLRSLKQAFDLLLANGQSGKGAAIRLLRGDTFAGYVIVSVSGQDREHPLVVEDYWHDYGEGRPDPGTRPLLVSDLRLGQKGGLLATYAGGRPITPDHVVIRRLQFAQTGRSADDVASSGLSVMMAVRNWTVDDCSFANFTTGVTFQCPTLNGRASEVNILRTIVVDSHKNTDGTDPNLGRGTQAMYMDNVDRLYIAQSTFDNNGRTTQDLSGRTIYSHNLYIQSNCGPATVWGNVIRAGSSHGVQLRPGGILAYNYFGRNAIAGLVGVSGAATHNVVELAEDIDAANPRGWGIEILDGTALSLDANFVVNVVGTGPRALITTGSYKTGILDAVVRHNTVVRGGPVWYTYGSTSIPHSVRAEWNLGVGGAAPVVRVANLLNAWDWYRSDHNAWNADGSAFTQGGADPISWSSWRQMTGSEAASIGTPPALVNDRASIADYAGTAGAPATEAAFVDRVRNRPAGAWGDLFDATRIYRFFASQYRPTGLPIPTSADAYYGAVDYATPTPIPTPTPAPTPTPTPTPTPGPTPTPKPTPPPAPTPRPTPLPAPEAPGLIAAQDTGRSDTDGVTRVHRGLSFAAGTTPAGLTVELWRDGARVAAAPGGDPALRLVDPAELGDGLYAFAFRVVDPATGAWREGVSTRVTVDRRRPVAAAVLTRVTPGRIRTSGRVPSFRVVVPGAEAGATVQLLRRPRGSSGAYVPVAGRVGSGTIADATNPAARVYQYVTRLVDLAGNVGNSSRPVAVTVAGSVAGTRRRPASNVSGSVIRR